MTKTTRKRPTIEDLMVHPRRGLPKKGTETGPTVPRSIRFPAALWTELEWLAKSQGLTLHAALRAAVLAWLEQHAHVRDRARRVR